MSEAERPVPQLRAKYLGHSVNATFAGAMIEQVEAMLIRQKPNIKSFHEDNGQDLLARARSTW